MIIEYLYHLSLALNTWRAFLILRTKTKALQKSKTLIYESA